MKSYFRAEYEEDRNGRGELSTQEAQQILDIRTGAGKYEEAAEHVV